MLALLLMAASADINCGTNDAISGLVVMVSGFRISGRK